ncbi:MAG: sigma factor, partial [Planctomycetota bacterium]
MDLQANDLRRSQRDADPLLERWASDGDSAALAALFDLAAPRLLALAIHFVGESARAEDLVQAVFLTLIEKRMQIERGTRAEAWLARVLRNKVIDQRRVRREEPLGEPGALALADLEA